MNPNARLIPALIALVICVAGCTQSVSTLGFASTNSVDLSQKYALVASDVSDKSSGLVLLLFINVEDPSYYKALGHCLSQYNGDVLTDVKVTLSNYYFIIGAYTEYKVTGNVWKMVDEVGSRAYKPGELFDLRMINGESRLVSQNGAKTHKVFLRRS